MKKIIVFFIFLIFCFVLPACTYSNYENSSTDITKQRADLKMSEKQELFQGTTTAQSSYDTSYGVGRGINALTDKYIEVSGRYTPIFDSQKILDLKWIKTKIKYQEAEVISDTNATNFQKQLSTAYSRKTSAAIGINGLFTTGLENDFSISNELEISKDTKEIIAKLYQNINGFSIEIEGYNDYRNFYNMLSDGFLNYLDEIRESNYDESKINQLFNFYGTHIVMAGYYGGRIECNYHLMFEDASITDSSMINYKNNAKAALTDAQYSASLSNETGFSIKNKIGQNINTTLETFTYKGRGGSYFAGSSIDGFMSNYSFWVNSFNENEEDFSVLVDIPDKALMPIWLLIPNEYSDVANEIERAFTSKADFYYNQWLQKSAYTYKDSGNVTDYGGGDGTKDNPYLLKDETHLKNISKNIDKKAYFKIVNDITITDTKWTPLGTYYCKKSQNSTQQLNTLGNALAFNGYLDGNNKTISYDLNIDLLNTTNDYDYGFGIFGLVKTAEIKNLTVNATIYCSNMTNGNYNCAAAITGWAIDSYFENCNSYGSIKQNHIDIHKAVCFRSGGQVGLAKYCNFNQCVNYADVFTANYYATSGGIAGGNVDSKYVSCQNHGKIESSHGSWLAGSDNHGDLYGKV